MNRTANVVRMQLINRQTFVWTPLLILSASFAITLAVFGIIAAAVSTPITEPMYSGAVQAPLWYFAVVGIQSLYLGFPFSQAMSVSRREFFTGTMLTAAGTALGLSAIYLIGGVIEQATDGWGIHGYFFRLPWLWDQGPWAAALFYFTGSMLVFLIGFLGATVYQRFGLLWLIVGLVGVAAVLVLAALGITLTDSWSAVGRTLAHAEALYVALIGVGVAAVLAGLSYLTLRRATP
ncbi:hypothetical protein MUG78_09495 [Gordonia alkaliphila]|uniref:hypothetical protein n=1 Tax=Gordonia alkaliphila TaxID=1053547 RepID=UPI001FF166A8|nr:hypothetical protein [Gordonia alkaliphila]MCK0439690.1 hypothetical protein [Gordonia alkaliphila]